MLKKCKTLFNESYLQFQIMIKALSFWLVCIDHMCVIYLLLSPNKGFIFTEDKFLKSEWCSGEDTEKICVLKQNWGMKSKCSYVRCEAAASAEERLGYVLRDLRHCASDTLSNKLLPRLIFSLHWSTRRYCEQNSYRLQGTTWNTDLQISNNSCSFSHTNSLQNVLN